MKNVIRDKLIAFSYIIKFRRGLPKKRAWQFSCLLVIGIIRLKPVRVKLI